MDCLFTNEETKYDIPTYVAGDGVVRRLGLHPERVEGHKPEIARLLEELAPEFQGEFGYSFLNMCNAKDGRQWGDHPDMDELVVLGVAAGYVELLPKNKLLWQVEIGGMPRVKITLPTSAQKMPVEPQRGMKTAIAEAQEIVDAARRRHDNSEVVCPKDKQHWT